MSDVAQKIENNAESVVNGAAGDIKADEQIANNENATGDEKKQKKKKPNNKSECGMGDDTPSPEIATILIDNRKMQFQYVHK